MENATSANISSTVFGRCRTLSQCNNVVDIVYENTQVYMLCKCAFATGKCFIHFHLCSTYCLAGVIIEI